MQKVKFENKDMSVTYYIEKVHACCGAGMITGASFDFNVPHRSGTPAYRDFIQKARADKEMHQRFYKEWWSDFKKYTNQEINRNMIIFIDAVNGEMGGEWPCLYDFGVTIGATMSKPILNERSSRKIVTFTINKPIADGVTGQLIRGV